MERAKSPSGCCSRSVSAPDARITRRAVMRPAPVVSTNVITSGIQVDDCTTFDKRCPEPDRLISEEPSAGTRIYITGKRLPQDAAGRSPKMIAQQATEAGYRRAVNGLGGVGRPTFHPGKLFDPRTVGRSGRIDHSRPAEYARA
ncbi:hypothetical protein GA0071312_1310 [Saliniramus fredricksonii]|uniref:Uncharacterized protein n=1 Tax=Saliniramus fredricksonii TaxID=1653334 RepID=A0ABY0K7D9_9HYPH|nr:hypothetical protein GA0071312_1310 [Saliniramus fredricksonii]